MLLTARGYQNTYEIESLGRMLFPGLLAAQPLGDDSGDVIDTAMERYGDDTVLSVTVRLDGRQETRTQTVSGLTERECVLPLALLLYDAAVALTGRPARWGILTGIRPIKLFHTALGEGLSDAQIAERMKQRYAMRGDMITLALSIARAEQKVNTLSRSDGFSLYVSIPFCPQRCSYCSFVSHTVERAGGLIPQYVALLCEELASLGELSKRYGLRPQTVYFGGGTPTTLTAEQLTRLFETIDRSFDLSGLLEYTVEAGRPDTIDVPRMEALRRAGVTRVSVNPQTMDDAVLEAVGRRHTAADVERAYELVRTMGFESVNMDLIAGLPSDKLNGFTHSLERVLALRPENLTVHTLTLKRSSALAAEDAERHYRRCDETAEMVDIARGMAASEGYSPYYLYRQKNSIGNLDNTGYTLPGHAGVYNVFIMDETQTILAAGAGAVTKLRAGDGSLKRIFNHKYPYEYISRYREIAARKEQVREFYENDPPQTKFGGRHLEI